MGTRRPRRKAEPFPWEDHEDHVAALYRLLGYTVTQNLNVDGQQTDLICEKWIAGSGKTVLYVDCKYTQSRVLSSVSNDDVDRFITTFHSRKIHNGWTAGILVSNRPFSQSARAAAAPHSDIVLKTISDLHEDVFQARAYLHTAVHRYETEATFADYIPLLARNVDNTMQPAGPASSLKNEIDEWLCNSASPQLCLLGDFGSGKTTFLKFLHYCAARDYLSGKTNRIPLLVSLREYYDSADGPDLIRRFFSLELAVSLQYSIFDAFLRAGRFLLLFDGFDEMGPASDSLSRRRNYLKLAAFAVEHSKLIITCRPAYFVSQSELAEAFSFLRGKIGFPPPARLGERKLTQRSVDLANRLQASAADHDIEQLFVTAYNSLHTSEFRYIDLFSDSQIRGYLKKYQNDIAKLSEGQLNPDTLLELIREIYDLEDLARRPILLKLIVRTLPLFKKDPSGAYRVKMGRDTLTFSQITPSLLYHVYTEAELAREYEKGEVRWEVDRDDKRDFIAALAFQMFATGSAVLDRSTLEAAVSQRFKLTPDTLDHVITNIRTCSFLVRDRHDCFHFTHKSFTEYYAALHIVPMLRSAGTARKTLSQCKLSEEIFYFLGDIIATSASGAIHTLHELDASTKKVESEADRRLKYNVVNLLLFARSAPTALEHLEVDDLFYVKQSMVEVTHMKCVVDRMLFRRCRFQLLEENDVSVKTMQLFGTRVDQLRLSYCTIDRMVLSDFTGELTGEQSWVKSLEVSGGVIRRLILTGCRLRLDEGTGSHVDEVLCKECVISSSSAQHILAGECRKWSFRDCAFVDCDVPGELLKRADFSDCVFVRCKCADAIEPTGLARCRGVLYRPKGSGLGGWSAPGYPSVVTFGQARKAVQSPSPVPSWQEAVCRWFPVGGSPADFKNVASVREVLRKISDEVSGARRKTAHVGDVTKEILERKVINEMTEDLARILARERKDVSAMVRMGDCLYATAELAGEEDAERLWAEALGHYEKAYLLKADNHDAHCNSAAALCSRAYRAVGDRRDEMLRDAKERCHKALKLVSDCPFAVVTMSEIAEAEMEKASGKRAARLKEEIDQLTSTLGGAAASNCDRVIAWTKVLVERAQAVPSGASKHLLSAAIRKCVIVLRVNPNSEPASRYLTQAQRQLERIEKQSGWQGSEN